MFPTTVKHRLHVCHEDIPLMRAREAEMRAAGAEVVVETLEDRGLVALQV